MPATFGIADISIAGMARSYNARLSLFVVAAFPNPLALIRLAPDLCPYGGKLAHQIIVAPVQMINPGNLG